MSVLQVQGLAKTFGRRKVVDGVDLNVNRGEIVGLLGPNGAGKSTCFKMICGMLAPDHGEVFLNDVNVTNWPMFRRAKVGGLGYLAQNSSVFRKLTTEQNLLAMMELLGFGRKARKARCERLLEQFNITLVRKSKAFKLSGGEKRRLEIARCLVSDPEVIMLDEPFAAIDPVTVQSIQSVIRDLRDRDIGVLITDHSVREILEITDRTYVIINGKMVCHGSADVIVNNTDVKREYLGELNASTTNLKTTVPSPHLTPSTTGSKRPRRRTLRASDLD